MYQNHTKHNDYINLKMMKGQGVILNNIVPKSHVKIIAEKPCMQFMAATYTSLVDKLQ